MSSSENVVSGFIYLMPAFVSLAILIAAVIHYIAVGPVKFEPNGDEKIPWWSRKERLIHWILMITFVIVVFTGIILAVSPVKSGENMIDFVRHLHDISMVFSIATLIMLIIWVRFAIFKRYDLTWLRRIGGYFGFKGVIKAGKFNAGQKLWFWIAVIITILLGYSGGRIGSLEAGSTRNAYILIHMIGASCIMGMFVVHLYTALFVVKGSFKGILTGKINKKIAKKMHSEANPFKGR